MILEIHCHTHPASPCSRLPTVDAIRLASQRGLEGIVLTEHHFLWPEQSLAEFREAAEVPSDFVVLAAQEVSTTRGHVLVYGATERIEPELTVDEIREEHPGAALVWAHPWRSGNQPQRSVLSTDVFDGIEILNGNQTTGENLCGLKAWRELGFTALAGSDSHDHRRVAQLSTIFDFPVASIADLIGQIQEGTCRPLLNKHPAGSSR